MINFPIENEGIYSVLDGSNTCDNFGYSQLKSLGIDRAFPGDQHRYFALIASVFITKISPQIFLLQEGSDIDPGGP